MLNYNLCIVVIQKYHRMTWQFAYFQMCHDRRALQQRHCWRLCCVQWISLRPIITTTIAITTPHLHHTREPINERCLNVQHRFAAIVMLYQHASSFRRKDPIDYWHVILNFQNNKRNIHMYIAYDWRVPRMHRKIPKPRILSCHCNGAINIACRVAKQSFARWHVILCAVIVMSTDDVNIMQHAWEYFHARHVYFIHTVKRWHTSGLTPLAGETLHNANVFLDHVWLRGKIQPGLPWAVWRRSARLGDQKENKVSERSANVRFPMIRTTTNRSYARH